MRVRARECNGRRQRDNKSRTEGKREGLRGSVRTSRRERVRGRQATGRWDGNRKGLGRE